MWTHDASTSGVAERVSWRVEGRTVGTFVQCGLSGVGVRPWSFLGI